MKTRNKSCKLNTFKICGIYYKNSRIYKRNICKYKKRDMFVLNSTKKLCKTSTAFSCFVRKI